MPAASHVVLRRFSAVVLASLTLTACLDRDPPTALDPGAAAFAATGPAVLPIPQQAGAQPVPLYVGEPATPSPVVAWRIPQNRFMAPNGLSNMHDDAYMSDTYAIAGPLGQAPMQVVTGWLGTAEAPVSLPASMAFDRYGRVLVIALDLVGQTIASKRLLLLEPRTLEILASLQLPAGAPGSNAAGGYFFLDRLDRAVVPTATGQVWVVAVTGGWNRPRFDVKRVYDLSAAVGPNDEITSVIPDFGGTYWAVSKGGTVATLDPANGRVASVRLPDEQIGNSLASDESGGVFIVSDHALYRFDAGRRGEPTITWREEYDRGTRVKPGQFLLNFGSGTTPTLMGRDFVAIADNADPFMHVLVYRRAAQVTGPRLVASVPVFDALQGATENSLVATERSIIVENNYGYFGTAATSGGQATMPGLTRIDIDEGGGHVVWTSAERVPSVVTKASLANGLIYTYTKDAGPGTTDAWYLTAIDFHTGRTVFKQLAGTGILYNNHYAAIYLGPDGTVYIGVLGGVVAIRDGI